jgi:hypothetical protein
VVDYSVSTFANPALLPGPRATLAPSVPVRDHERMARGNYWEYSFRPDSGSDSSRRDRGHPAARARPALADLAAADGRPCAQGEWCASAVTADGPDGPERVPLKGPRAFCAPDRGKILTALDSLPRDYAALAADLGNPGQAAGAVRSPFGPRIPLRLGNDALMSAIAESLVSWHERIAALEHLAPLPDRDEQGRRTAREGWLVGQAARILLADSNAGGARLDALLALAPEPMRRAATHRLIRLLGDDAPDGIVKPGYAATWPELGGAGAGLEILRLHRMTRAVLGETRARPVELLGVPCRVEECDMLALRRADLPEGTGPGDEDAPWSECGSCGDVMTELEYRLWVRRYAQWAAPRGRETLG